jgi:serine/threonine-protein kinase HipA
VTRELGVWYATTRVGTFAQADDGRQSFTYAPSWLTSADAFAISLSMPLRTEPYDNRTTRAFFGGLLPDDDARRRLARYLQVSARNEFALLAEVGRECAGALSLLPPAEEPTPPTGWVRRLTEDEFAGLLRDLPHRPLLTGTEVRLSLAGAQDKVAVRLVDGGVALPLDGGPTTHIVKTPIAGYQDTVANEGFCMRLAGAVGLPVAPVEIRDIAGLQVLFLERFDRIASATGELLRVHQEDFCQALGIAPERKYQSEGGPGFAALFDVLTRHSARAALDRLQLLEMAVFHFLLGNADAHAKNYSLLLQPEGTRLAPVYDALSTIVYPALSTRMAMKIGGRREFAEVRAEHWASFAKENGLAPAIVRDRIGHFAAVLPTRARELAASDPVFAASAIVTEICDRITDRCNNVSH